MSYIFKKKKYVNGYINNLEVIGVPNIDGSMISNFSTSNYLRFSKTPNLSSLTNWQMYFQITTGSGTADQQLLGGLTTDRAGIEIGIISSKLKLWLGSVNATNHDISTDNAVIGTTTIKPLTKYWLKLEFTGKQYILSISENGKDYNGEIAIHSSLPIRTNELSICLDKYAGNRPFLGIFDLDGFYITSGGKYIWIPYKRSKYDYNFSVFGLPIITNAPSCEVSGFSSANYLQPSKTFPKNTTDFEILLKVKFSTVSATQYFFNTAPHYSCLIGLESSKFKFWLSNNTTSWDIGSAVGTTTIVANNWYYIKFTYDGETYKLFLSTDNKTWNLEASLSSTKPLGVNYSFSRIGHGFSDNPGTNTTFDLTQSYIKINGELWWNCFRTTDNVIHTSDGSSKDYDYITAKCYSLKRKFLKKGYINNFTTVGNPSFDGSVVSGFSSANYLKTFGIPNDVSSFEFGVKFTTGDTIKKQQGILANSSTNIYTPQLIIDNTGYLEGLTPTKVGTWGTEINTPYVLEANTTYWAKYGWDGEQCYLDVSLDGEVYERVGTVTHSSIGWTEVLGIGIDQTSNPFLGSIDLSESYIRINNEFWWTPYKRCKYDYNFNVSGSPSISTREETCTFGNFSSANYITLPKNFDVSDGSSWEMVYKIRTGDDITTGQSICGHTGSSNYDPVNPCIKSSKFQLTTTKSSSSNIFSDVYGTATLEANTDYFVKIVFDGSAYILSYSTDGETFIEDIRKESTTPVWASNLAIGRQQGDASEYPWLGSIDLSQSYIKVNDKLWWSCFKQTTDIVYEEDGSEEDYDYQTQIGYNCCAPIKRYYKYVPWKQPILTADDSNKSFIVSASDVYNNESGYKAWRSFSSNTTSDSWLGNTTAPSETAPKYYTMQSSVKLKFKSILMTNRTAEAQYVGAISSFKIQASDNGEDWVDLTETLSNTNNTSASSWNIEINSEQGYLYHRFVIYGSNTSNRTSLGHPKITADMVTPATYGDYDFYEIEGEKIAHTFTINPTPENAIVMINGEERNTLRVKKGGDINWSVSIDGYISQSGTLRLTENTVLDVALREGQYYTFTINASNEHNNSTPVVVRINGEVTNSITAIEGTEITYSVDCIGYQSKYGTLTLTEDTVLDIVLIGNP